jgi:transcriptional regulator with XRE-family HTH domain
VSKAGLSLIERGVREASIETLLGLAHSLEAPPEAWERWVEQAIDEALGE